LDRQEYIEYLLDHFQNPRNRHRMEDADVQLGGGNPGCGDLITMYLRIEGDRITEASFEGEGCTISQAGGSIITELVEGLTLDEVKELGTHTMKEEMGEDVVKSRVRCATLALGTVQAAIDQYRNNQRRADLGAKPEIVPVTFENWSQTCASHWQRPGN
jgi:nitrogen fixation protein NifU and related proteins